MDYELPDGTVLALPRDATGADAAAAIGPGLARAALAASLGCTADWIGIADQQQGFGWREFI